MDLYLLRHADAEPHALSDRARELTPKGTEQARAVGEFCRVQMIRPRLILTSPYRRTVQTAALVAEALGGACPVEEAAFLASGMDPQTALAELRAYLRFESVMMIGHQPDFGQVAATLLGVESPDNLPFGKASLMCLEVGALRARGGSLKFFIPVKMARGN